MECSLAQAGTLGGQAGDQRQQRERVTNNGQTDAPRVSTPKGSRVRMSAAQRREQLIAIGRQLFAERGVDATSVEEVASRANVSKPVVYEHFGGKEGLYAVVVDREMRALL